MLGGWEVLQLSTEEQARYADYLHVLMCKDENFLKSKMNEDPNFAMWTPTTVGNHAYMALHGPESYKRAHLEKLERFVKWKAKDMRVD